MTLSRTVRMTPAAVLGTLGMLGTIGWTSGWLVLASVQSRYIPMAPITALAFLALTVAFMALGANPRRAPLAMASAMGVVFIGIATLIRRVMAVPDLERSFVPDPGAFDGVPLARISPVTAMSIAVVGIAIVLITTLRTRAAARHVAGWLGTAVTLAGCTVVLGYAYDTPLLYGGHVIPVALPTALGLVAAGIATISETGVQAWPLRAFVGTRASSQLLRAFLPATAVVFLLASAGGHALVQGFNANPAFAAAASTIGATVVVAAIVWRIAATVGGAIDRAQEALTQSKVELEAAVAERTADLARANQELEAFSFSVSHDLRAPVRHVAGFAALLQKDMTSQLSPQGRSHVDRIVQSSDRMSRLIEDLLQFSRTARADLKSVPIELRDLVTDVLQEAERDIGDRRVEWSVGSLPRVAGDRALLRLAVTNLISNALKYTSGRDIARIAVDTQPSHDGECVLFVRDNGVGFDMAYADKLFGVFQRLHRAEEFEGTGIGLANVRRIVQRHGGRTWAEGKVNEGATFYVALPTNREERNTSWPN